ncbi:hypothetical protein KUTeg_002687 [Tegillarca granosa]|uniref:NlpC/P60 domain-containing protein n=1 Tax=Tegillarca granosa TaxID=220873 RepID=A0ABQ9FXW6_TEGGR|nr:hypothetical protein KUTeg_002687 [Tegillarca granosa]
MFLSFKEILRKRRLKELRKRHRSDPGHADRLRQKFVNQAKKYFGVPYARKYWPPESLEYKSPLFLDCCALVRQVVRDLEDDFGFRIGPWNQAYMFDTLPNKIEHERDMKPGDLVFMSGVYHKKKRQQKHHMTHVEIWAGDGNKTIGARWNNGKVQVFDSYRFEAKSFHSTEYHFRSIDTWLHGTCKSFCPQHRWKRSKYSPKKKSVFHVEVENQVVEQEQDEAAGDSSDNETSDSRPDSALSL